MTNQQQSIMDLELGQFNSDSNKKKSFNLKNKATFLAIAIGTIPVLITGATGYYFANKSITKEIITSQETQASEVQDKIGRFMQERLGDIQVLTGLEAFTNPAKSTQTEKVDLLERIEKAYGVYDSIAVFDIKGNVNCSNRQRKKNLIITLIVLIFRQL
ncbi:MAG: hypothetical protein HC930_17485 [Hydrococcus sp. SU_1_0]|nr:hypothetical protein [Hydrococcus sp. SU_1_0]